ncbi:MAG: hypothetical protein FJ213_12215 [Ignavibacteria bacterium]|nr:hypothetical protein [Ignavibacteria bacterium]
MKRLLSIVCLFLSISFFECAPSKYKIGGAIYFPAEISFIESVYSSKKSFSSAVPEGWFSTMDKNLDIDEIWLAKENYSGVIKIVVVHFPVPLEKQELEERLLISAELSFELMNRKFGEKFAVVRKPALFESGNILYSDYEFKFENDQFARILIFEKNGKTFELFAYTSDYKASPKIDLLEFYSIQQSLLSTIQ